MSLSLKKNKMSLPIAFVEGIKGYIYLDLDDFNGTKRLTIPSNFKGTFFPLITHKNKNRRNVFFIAGASGCGKSTFARKLVESYKKMYKKREIYLISMLKEDPTIDPINPLRIKISSLVKTPLELEEPDENDDEDEETFGEIMEDHYNSRLRPAILQTYRNRLPMKRKQKEQKIEKKEFEPEIQDCMLIADDVDAIPNKKQDKAVLETINKVAITGRHYNISLVYISHYLSNYHKTRLMHMESDFIVVFPLCENKHHFHTVLLKYYSVDEEDRNYIKQSGSRWACISKKFPKYCILENEIFMLNQQDVQDINNAGNVLMLGNTKT